MLKEMYLRKKIDWYDRKMDELFADTEERSVKSFDGTRIAYRTVGEGMPLVISPGVFTTYMFFHFMKDYFSPRHQVVLWDYRGHPESEVPSDLESITIENCARDLKVVLDDLGVRKAVMIGFSMGVMTIFEFFNQHPEMVHALIPINGPYAEGFGFVTDSRKGQEQVVRLLKFLSHNPWLVEWFRTIIPTPINIPIAKRVELNPTLCAEEEMKLYFDYTVKMDWHAGFQALAAMGEYDGTDVLDKVDVPTLLICGENDSWTPKRIADEMHRRIKGSEYTTIPGGSHATPAENPQMINFRIDLFLRTHFHETIEKSDKRTRVPARKPAKATKAKAPARKKAAVKRKKAAAKKA